VTGVQTCALPISEKIRYLDSSVALRIIFGHSQSAIDWLDGMTESDTPVISSRLLELEVVRALRREGRGLSDAEELVDSLTLLNLDTAIVAEAAAIEPHVKSLDALHLASALRAGTEFVQIVTHDENMSRVAKALGFDTFDPVA
jgi:predicted nucleic acid-binding protein